MKNPGVGTLEELLGIDLAGPVQEKTAEFVAKWTLPSTQESRKRCIREDPAILVDARATGSRVLKEVRDQVLSSLVTKPGVFVGTLVKMYLMDCDSEFTDPRYLKVTGWGDGSLKHPYSAKVHDPFAVDFADPSLWSMAPCGNEGIKFFYAGRPVCLLRAKFASEKLSSSLKFSVDPA
jgi:hypothetical protein